MTLSGPAQAILEEAAARYAVDVETIRGRSRGMAVTKARRRIVRQLTEYGWSDSEIGLAINRSRSDVVWLKQPLPSAARRDRVSVALRSLDEVGRTLSRCGLGHIAAELRPARSVLGDLSRAAGDVDDLEGYGP